MQNIALRLKSHTLNSSKKSETWTRITKLSKRSSLRRRCRFLRNVWKTWRQSTSLMRRNWRSTTACSRKRSRLTYRRLRRKRKSNASSKKWSARSKSSSLQSRRKRRRLTVTWLSNTRSWLNSLLTYRQSLKTSFRLTMFVSRMLRLWIKRRLRRSPKRSCTATRSFMNSSSTSHGSLLPTTRRFHSLKKTVRALLIQESVIQATKALKVKLKENRRWTKTHRLWTVKIRGWAAVSLIMTTINPMWLAVTKTTETSRTNTKKSKMCSSCWSMKPSTSLTTKRLSDAAARAWRSSSRLRSTLSARVSASMSYLTLSSLSRLYTTTNTTMSKPS